MDQLDLFGAAAESHVPAAASLYELTAPDGVVFAFPGPRHLTPEQLVRQNDHWKSVGEWRPVRAKDPKRDFERCYVDDEGRRVREVYVDGMQVRREVAPKPVPADQWRARTFRRKTD